MTSKKKAPLLKQAAATQRMSKDELQELLKKAEAEDPDAAAADDDEGERSPDEEATVPAKPRPK